MNCKVNNEFINLNKRYLNVKLPINLGAIVGQYKVWSKRWVQFECNNENKSSENISVDLLIFRSQKSGNFMYRQKFYSHNTAIFRCQSRTRTYAFTICIDNIAAIHLSANSETESQVWMQYFRNSLWPPNPLMEFENCMTFRDVILMSLKGHFYASVIDNENSHRSGLLGAYGYLQVSNTKIVLTHSQTGYVIQEWLLSLNTLKNPFENVLQIIRNASSFCGLQNIFIFCIDAKEVIERINRKRELENCVKCREESKEHSLVISSFSTENMYEFKQILSEQQIQSKQMDCNTFRIRSAKEIPETMLNCSITSCNRHNLENIYSEPIDPIDNIEDIYEDIDKIYEEIANQDYNEILIESDFNTNEENKNIVDIVPELPPKRRFSFSSDPIKIKSNFNYDLITDFEDIRIVGYDMFSKIVRQTNISSLNTRRVYTKSMKQLSDILENDVSKRESDNDYYEMRPVLNKSLINKTNFLSDNEIYVDMKWFSI